MSDRLQPTMSVTFWAAACMQLACQLIISFITGQKTSRRLQTALWDGEELFISDIHLRCKSSCVHRDKMWGVGTVAGVLLI